MRALTRRDLLRAAGVAAMGAGAHGALAEAIQPPGTAPVARPNFLVILADDMGFSDPGCYGGEIQTPNLDRLAANGLRYTQFYNTARCWPTRACLLTGYYSQQVNIATPRGPMPRWARTTAHHLKELGYRCYHSGKWHLPGRPDKEGGFDRSRSGGSELQHFSPSTRRGDSPGPDAALDHGTDLIAQYAIDCLKEHAAAHAGSPFYSYVAFHSPHFPLHALQADIARYRQRYLAGWDAIRAERHRRQREMGIVNCPLAAMETDVRAPGWNDQYAQKLGPGEINHALPWKDLSDEQRRFQATKMAIHAAMVDQMDRQIGRIVEQVRAMHRLEDTVILFASDNGASAEILIRGDGHDPAAPAGSSRSHLCLGPGWSTAANTPFRRHKIWVHEGGIATPLIVHWPRAIAARNELRHDVGHMVDITPTLTDLAGRRMAMPVGAPPPPGISLGPSLAKDGATRREFVYFSHSGNRALRMGNHKIVSAKGEPWALYDLSVDRGEQDDLAAKQPERLRQMADRWKQLDGQYAREGSVAGGRKKP